MSTVVIDERRLSQLLNNQTALAEIPALKTAATLYAQSASKRKGCGCNAKADPSIYTLAKVKTVIGTLGKEDQVKLKRILGASKYQITYMSPGRRLVKLTV